MNTKFLFVTSIIQIVFGGIIFSIFSLGAIIIISPKAYGEFDTYTNMTLLFNMLYSATMVAGGLVGIINHKKYYGAVTCMILGILSIIIQLFADAYYYIMEELFPFGFIEFLLYSSMIVFVISAVVAMNNIHKNKTQYPPQNYRY